MKLERQSDQWPKRVAEHKQAVKVDRRQASSVGDWWPPVSQDEWGDPLAGAVGDDPMYGGAEDRYREFLNDHVIELTNEEIVDEFDRLSQDPGFEQTPLGQVMSQEMESRAEDAWESSHDPSMWSPKQGARPSDKYAPGTQMGDYNGQSLPQGTVDHLNEIDKMLQEADGKITGHQDCDQCGRETGWRFDGPTGQMHCSECGQDWMDMHSRQNPGYMAGRSAARPPVADHAFKPYSDDPERCVAELADSGDTCNQLVEKHQMVSGEVLRNLRARGVFGSRRQAGDDPLGTCDSDDKTARRQAVRVRIDTRLLHQLDDDRDDSGAGGAEELEFGSEDEALEHLNNLAADWDTDLVPAKGYVDYDGGSYDDDPDGTTYLFNGPVTDQERQGFATILHGSRRQAVRVEIDRQSIPQIVRLAGRLPRGGGAERVFIHLDRVSLPNAFEDFGKRVFPFYNYFQPALLLLADGVIDPLSVLRVAAELVIHHGRRRRRGQR
jgi:hypothetical protein